MNRNLCGGIKFRIELPRDGGARIESMTPGQMTAYLAAAACENKTIGAALRFELLTGMRLGEVRKVAQPSGDSLREATSGNLARFPGTP